MSCSDIAHFALLYKHCVKQFKGTLGSIARVLSTLNIQQEFVSYTWGKAQSLWAPLFCHQVITLWGHSVLK